MTTKRHEIKTIEDFYNAVNIHNVDNFLEGLNEMVRKYVFAIENVREQMRKRGVDDSKFKNSDIARQESITYIDDNKQDNKFIVK